MIKPWTYRGRRVIVPHTADIPRLHDNQQFRRLIQEVLDQVPPWQAGTNSFARLTADTGVALDCLVVPIGTRPIRWHKHVGHKARNRQVSPFVEIRPIPKTTKLSVELAGSPSQPMLVRAYPGMYTPPLPWQASSGDALGGRQACLKFWKEHAYVHRDGRVVPDSQVFTTPIWFTK